MHSNALCQGGDITIIDASLPCLRHFSLVVKRRPGTSTKNAAYIVKALTADAALETLDLQCDYKGWDTAAIYRAIKRHSKTLRVLCAPGWYAHTAMLQALDGFTVLGEVTIGRFVHLEVRQLPLPNCLLLIFPGERPEGLQEDPKGLPLQSPTCTAASYKRDQDATPSKRLHRPYLWPERGYRQGWSIHPHMDGEHVLSFLPIWGFLYCIFRPIGHTTQSLNDHGGTSSGIWKRLLRIQLSSNRNKTHFSCPRLASLSTSWPSPFRPPWFKVCQRHQLLELLKSIRDSVMKRLRIGTR
jgi:hypothetical protein